MNLSDSKCNGYVIYYKKSFLFSCTDHLPKKQRQRNRNAKTHYRKITVYSYNLLKYAVITSFY